MPSLDFPECLQTFKYDCGAKAIQAVFAYYGIEFLENVLLKEAKTSRRAGTMSDDMCRVLKKHGLEIDAREMTIVDLKEFIDKKIPVIIRLQAWDEETIKRAHDYTDEFGDDHWVVVIGYEKKKIIFSDPYSFERTFLTEKELMVRWHGKEKGKKNFCLGIAAFGKKPLFSSQKMFHMV
jgi:ABC-type bacteriocin/lantibiotic exporter with double-glycine peptidase domain